MCSSSARHEVNRRSEDQGGLYASQAARSYLRFPATASICADWFSAWVTHESTLRLNLYAPKLCAEEVYSTHAFTIMLHLSEKKPKKGRTSSTRNRCSSSPFAKLGLDVSGPYPKNLSGKKYIIGFVAWYSGWPEAFAVPDKTGETVANVLLEQIISRYSTHL